MTMSIRNQLWVVLFLSVFVVTPILVGLMGLIGLIINVWCTLAIFFKYWGETDNGENE
jgi:hypothetical protein